MATEQLLLTGVGASDQWTLIAGASKVVACQTPDNDATNYIGSEKTAGLIQLFALANPALIGAGDTINSVTVRVRCIRGSAPGGSFHNRIVTSGGTLDGSAIVSGGGWADKSDIFSTKPGGGAWTLAALNELEAGIVNTQARDIHCTTVEVIVDYTAGSDDLDADSIATGTPSLGTPTAGQIHNLAATALVMAAAVVGIATIGQVHALDADAAATGGPALDTPGIGQEHALTAASAATGELEFGTPICAEISGQHDLTADSIATGSPAASEPQIAQRHALAAAEVVSGAPTLDTPDIAQTHALDALGLATGAAEVAQADLGLIYELTATSVEMGPPETGSPAVEELGPHELLADGVEAGVPECATPTVDWSKEDDEGEMLIALKFPWPWGTYRHYHQKQG